MQVAPVFMEIIINFLLMKKKYNKPLSIYGVSKKTNELSNIAMVAYSIYQQLA